MHDNPSIKLVTPTPLHEALGLPIGYIDAPLSRQEPTSFCHQADARRHLDTLIAWRAVKAGEETRFLMNEIECLGFPVNFLALYGIVLEYAQKHPLGEPLRLSFREGKRGRIKHLLLDGIEVGVFKNQEALFDLLATISIGQGEFFENRKKRGKPMLPPSPEQCAHFMASLGDMKIVDTPVSVAKLMFDAHP